MRFKNVSGDALDVPALGVVVQPGEIVEASGAIAKGLESQPAWQRTDTPARKAAAKAAAAGTADLSDEES